MADELTPLPRWLARVLVFGSSAAVLMLEILAGRLLAPYVGVSLETFTGVIGTVLAGIALGAWAGGALADQLDARRYVGPALVIGGALAWLALPIVRALGPQFGNGPVSIVIVTASAFFLPSAVLSAVTPMVAKLRLTNLGETGAVVGGLSAAGTIGALAGTFITGFVLIAAAPTRPIVVTIGAVLVAAGVAVHWYLARRIPPITAAPVLVVTLAMAVFTPSQCDHETGYFCVSIDVDPDNPSGRDLILDDLRHAYVDLDDPTVLDIRYIRLFAQVAGSLPAGSLDTLHIGGGGFSFPRYLDEVRPGTSSLVLEIDPELVTIAERELGLVQTDLLRVETGDARLALGDLADESYDLVIGDAFGSASVPWHLTTREFLGEVDRVMRPDGLYVMNVIDGGASRFVRAEVATLAELFAHVAVVLPADGVPDDRAVNHVLVASQRPLPILDIAPGDGVLLSDAELEGYVDGAEPLRDDFAPVDQMILG